MGEIAIEKNFKKKKKKRERDKKNENGSRSDRVKSRNSRT